MDDGTILLHHCSEGYTTKGIVMTENITEIERIIESKEKVAVLYDVIIDAPNPIVRGHLGSIGHGNKGIMKPNVTATGNLVISASSFNGNELVNCTDYIKCGLTSKSGRPMATPNVAGQASIISQFRFIETCILLRKYTYLSNFKYLSCIIL